MIWNREQFLSHMTFRYTGREIMGLLFGPLVGLEDRWKCEGAIPSELDLSAFGLDSLLTQSCRCITGVFNDLKPRVLEDTREYRITIDNMGRKCKLMKGKATIPLPMEYPVKTMEDWLSIKHWYTFDERRVDCEWLRKLKRHQQEGTLITASIPGGFDEPRQLMGEEGLCLAYYDQPEVIKDIMDTLTDTALKTFDMVTDFIIIDNLCVHEDMAGKSGSLIGPSLIREYVVPYYKAVWDELKSQGSTLFSQDSDGNMNSVIDVFLDAGINVMYPFEPAAGMDMVKTRKKYGARLGIKGGIDKYALLRNKADILSELEYKICDATKEGGTVFALDHCIPNGVSLENFWYFVIKSKEMLGLPAPQTSPFVRL